MMLFHIVDRDIWARATEVGEYAPESLRTEGFLHLSYRGQVGSVANALYRDEDNLVVVEIDPAGVTHEIRVEDSYGSGESFPHVYGPIPTSAAVSVHELARDMHGDHRFNPGDDAGASALPDR